MADKVVTTESLQEAFNAQNAKFKELIENNASQEALKAQLNLLIESFKTLSSAKDETIKTQLNALSFQSEFNEKYAEALKNLTTLESKLNLADEKTSNLEEKLKDSEVKVTKDLEANSSFQSALSNILKANSEMALLRQEFLTLKEENASLAGSLQDAQSTSILSLETALSNQDKTLEALNNRMEALKEFLKQSYDLNSSVLGTEVQNLAKEVSKGKLLVDAKGSELSSLIKELNDNITSLKDIRKAVSLEDKEVQKDIAKDILKNPSLFPPFRLNPLVDSNADIFAQVRETLNTSREILRLFSTIEKDYEDFSKNMKAGSSEVDSKIESFKDIRDLAFIHIDKLIYEIQKAQSEANALVEATKLLQINLQDDITKTKEDKEDIELLSLSAKEYARLALEIKEDTLILRDDSLEAKETMKLLSERVRFWYESLTNLDVPSLTIKVHKLQNDISTLGDVKKEELTKLGESKKTELTTALNELFANLQSAFEALSASTKTDITNLKTTSLSELDVSATKLKDDLDKKALAHLASINTSKEASINALNDKHTNITNDLTTAKTTFINELTTTKTEAVGVLDATKDNSIKALTNAFDVKEVAFLAEMTKINEEIASLKSKDNILSNKVKAVVYRESATFTSDDATKNYMVHIQGARGFDNGGNGEVTSFGSYLSVAGGAGANNVGRGQTGECNFTFLTLAPNTSVPITIGNGGNKGVVTISYLEG
ncbi:hypothetical protein [Helicobacter sp. 11S02629-2]|uniref:hypothetical protein n=1 Tax=Helicobacter sp. 11S02629-2 TaxID=1476195 RepID=UPI000BA73A3A|nr:hypothetical protein [Helicobacter sp. 11S02629-2]PAF42762.1 hypothetical protein BKH40_07670 [Helicobacter sp. 11S02629-2]